MNEYLNIISLIESGENVLLHGPGGVGKTYIIRKILTYFLENGVEIYCTATTGIAALNIKEGMPEDTPPTRIKTLHSWAGIEPNNLPWDEIYAKIVSKYKSAIMRWRKTTILIVDEVSMLGADFFTKLDHIAKRMRKSSLPFGGLQVVFSGDFLQLPPVKDTYVFKCEAYRALNLMPIILEEPKRYVSRDYFDMLLRIRRNEIIETDKAVLYARYQAYEDYCSVGHTIDEVLPTVLYSKNVDVDTQNFNELEQLPGEEVMFFCEDVIMGKSKHSRPDTKVYTKLLDDSISRVIVLKEGAQVMLKANLAVEEGLVNGSRGVIMKVGDLGENGGKGAMVKFHNGTTRLIEPFNFGNEDKSCKYFRRQIPLVLAWAVTIHRSQGVTLDFAVCDVGYSIFCNGQAYVALSRVKDISGLFLSAFTPRAIKCSREARDYDSLIKDQYNSTAIVLDIEFDSDEGGESSGDSFIAMQRAVSPPPSYIESASATLENGHPQESY